MDIFCDKKTPFFVYSPDDGMMYFETEEEQRKFADGLIDGYLNGHWNEDVIGVTMGKVTHQATMTNREDRPPDDELDENCEDSEGAHWDPEVEYKCQYEMLTIEQQEAK